MSSASVPGPLGGPAPELPPEPGTQGGSGGRVDPTCGRERRLSPGDRIIESDLAAHLHMSPNTHPGGYPPPRRRRPPRAASQPGGRRVDLERGRPRGDLRGACRDGRLPSQSSPRTESPMSHSHRCRTCTNACLNSPVAARVRSGLTRTALAEPTGTETATSKRFGTSMRKPPTRSTAPSPMLRATLRLAAVVVGLQAVPAVPPKLPQVFARNSHTIQSRTRRDPAALRAGAPEWARAAATCHIHSTRELLVAPRRSDAVDT